MKTEKSIFIAFILNLTFSIFEFIGGFFTGSVAIISDALHDLGDATSIGIAFFFEKKSKKSPDEKYTYGYSRFSLIGSLITNFILTIGSITVIYNAILRIIDPTEINYNGMIIFAIVGICVNIGAAFLTRKGDSLNQKAVNLHMLEDVLGWIVVLVGAIIIKFTDLYILDPLMSIGVAVFIFISAIKNLKEIFEIFLEKAPHSININEIKDHLCNISDILDVHHIHIWSIDGNSNYATMHMVTDDISPDIKKKVRKELQEHGINHTTLEFESQDENCEEKECHIEFINSKAHHHHH